MFTGIVEEIGTINKVQKKTDLSTITVKAKKVLSGARLGDSIAIDGVCLTVVAKTKTTLAFDVMRETLKKSTLGRCKIGSHVNLERALKANDRISGHFVTGHVDAMAEVSKVVTSPNYKEVQIKIPKGLKKFIVTKGSICINGVSLTVGEVKANQFSVYLIPFTEEQTTFGLLKKADRVNIEIDILARYIQNQRGGK